MMKHKLVKPMTTPMVDQPANLRYDDGHFGGAMATPINEIGQAANFTNWGLHLDRENDPPHKLNWPGRQLYLWGWSF